jgi:iron complex outermembrane receptor protein
VGNGRDINGNPLEPQIETQSELGLKALLSNGRLSITFTLFDLTKTNIPIPEPGTFFPQIVGEARSRGLEIDVVGQVTNQVSVIGSYTYNRAIITEDPYNGTQGNRLPGVAPQVVSLWAKHDTAPGASTGWAFGAGVYASAQRQGDETNAWQLPGYGRMDAMIAYRIALGRGSLLAQLNPQNVFDRVYFDRGGSGSAAYGAPRTFIGSLRVDF